MWYEGLLSSLVKRVNLDGNSCNCYYTDYMFWIRIDVMSPSFDLVFPLGKVYIYTNSGHISI